MTGIESKKIKILIAAVFIISGGILGIYTYQSRLTKAEDYLTVSDIERTLKENDITLKEDETLSPDDYILGGEKPKIYKMYSSNIELFVYTYDALSKRKSVTYNGWYRDTEEWFAQSFPAKNALVVYAVPIENLDQGVMQQARNVQDIIFKVLNEGKTAIYRGESDAWIITCTLDYYEYFIENRETGVLEYDASSTHKFVIQYKLDDIDDVGPLEIEYDMGTLSGRSSGMLLDENGSAAMNWGSGSSGHLNLDDGIYFRVIWRDLEDEFNLKPEVQR